VKVDGAVIGRHSFDSDRIRGFCLGFIFTACWSHQSHQARVGDAPDGTKGLSPWETGDAYCVSGERVETFRALKKGAMAY